MLKVFIEFNDDVTPDQVAKALRKLDPGPVMIVESMTVENDNGHFALKRPVENVDDRIRRIVREEIGL